MEGSKTKGPRKSPLKSVTLAKALVPKAPADKEPGRRHGKEHRQAGRDLDSLRRREGSGEDRGEPQKPTACSKCWERSSA